VFSYVCYDIVDSCFFC